MLVIFAYGIAIGFVFNLPEDLGKRLPAWINVAGVGQLKETLTEVVVVVLIVIFASTVVEAEGQFNFSMLVLPVSILFIAAALRLIDFAGVKQAKRRSARGRRPIQAHGMQAMTQPGSAYSLEKARGEAARRHTMTVLVDNEPGVLARVIGLFSGRGYNIDSLTVSETEHEAHLSRITIVTSGPPMVIEQIQHQLERLVPMHSVTDLTVLGNPIERELALVKVAGKGEKRVEAMRLPRASAPRSSTPRPSISSSRSPASSPGSSSSSS